MGWPHEPANHCQPGAYKITHLTLERQRFINKPSPLPLLSPKREATAPKLRHGFPHHAYHSPRLRSRLRLHRTPRNRRQDPVPDLGECLRSGRGERLAPGRAGHHRAHSAAPGRARSRAQPREPGRSRRSRAGPSREGDARSSNDGGSARRSCDGFRRRLIPRRRRRRPVPQQIFVDRNSFL
ncbi:hypothetical protein SETIT_4G037600v2 [Setaria italica]|uniref:Uncharacterized protein n=1 Tax=Setaria italica TaxID=4555 RepID=A0A368QR32_SETIT|nr:hypothetical protein SETIT_4G037600v2 [Setaria italica]